MGIDIISVFNPPNEMAKNCNICGTEMKQAYIADSDGCGCGVVSALMTDIGYTDVGNLVFCPKCGNVQVDIKK